MKLMRTVVFAGAFVAQALSGAATEEPVRVRLSSAVATAPATVIVTATIERDARNRSLIVAADSEEFSTRSGIQLDGENDARLHQVWLKGLPEGHYIVTALVEGSDGPLGVTRVPMDVIGVPAERQK
jgi:hypothetical protein